VHTIDPARRLPPERPTANFCGVIFRWNICWSFRRHLRWATFFSISPREFALKNCKVWICVVKGAVRTVTAVMVPSLHSFWLKSLGATMGGTSAMAPT